MTTLHASDVVVRSDGPLAARIDDELVMLDPRRSAYFGLDPVAAEVWDLLDGSLAICDVCDRLVEHYDVDAETCLHDVLAFVVELADAELVEVRAGGPAPA
jgi:hypothetical protein